MGTGTSEGDQCLTSNRTARFQGNDLAVQHTLTEREHQKGLDDLRELSREVLPIPRDDPDPSVSLDRLRPIPIEL